MKNKMERLNSIQKELDSFTISMGRKIKLLIDEEKENYLTNWEQYLWKIDDLQEVNTSISNVISKKQIQLGELFEGDIFWVRDEEQFYKVKYRIVIRGLN